jgi:small GTP-binding protein
MELSKCTIRVGNDLHQFDIWDTGGQEQFRAIVPFYVRDASAGLILFDVTNRCSFDDLNEWINFFRRDRPTSFILIFGNKIDLPDRTVTTVEAAAFCEQNGIEYIEGSAKTGVGINAAFNRIIQQCIDGPALGQTIQRDVEQSSRWCC